MMKDIRLLSNIREESEVAFLNALLQSNEDDFVYEDLVKNLKSLDTFFLSTVRRVLLRIFPHCLTYDVLIHFLNTGDMFVCDSARVVLLQYHSKKLGYKTLLGFISSSVVAVRGKSEELLNKIPTSDMDVEVLMNYLVTGCRDIRFVIKRIFARFEKHQFDYSVLFTYSECRHSDAEAIARYLLVCHFPLTLTQKQYDAFLQTGEYDSISCIHSLFISGFSQT